MINNQDGGSAFPYVYKYKGDDDCENTELVPGMSLRDFFAGLAMQAILGNSNQQFITSVVKSVDTKEGKDICDTHAEMAYETADAMIKRRAKE